MSHFISEQRKKAKEEEPNKTVGFQPNLPLAHTAGPFGQKHVQFLLQNVQEILYKLFIKITTKMPFTTACLLVIMSTVVVVLLPVVAGQGSCRDAGFCCPGRDSSCVVQKAPLNAIIEDLEDKPCYCDHACLTLGDCCHDFKQACEVIDCEVSDWGDWSECDATCGHGMMTRSRSALRQAQNGGKECPELFQKRGCYGLRCPDHHNKAGRETALILPASFGHIRTMNESYDIRKNLRLRYPKDPVKESSKEYCVEFEIVKASKACHKGDMISVYKGLESGHTVCVRCESTAMRKYLGYRCKGHGMDEQPSRFSAMNNPSCHGRWIRRGAHDRCPCAGGPSFIFV